VTGDNDLAQALRYQALDKTGKTRSATANHCCVEGTGMAVGFIRWLQCADTIPTADGIAITIGNDVIAPLRREEFTLSRAGIATGAGVKHQQMIVETTCCARENMHALHHEGAID
jgi:hypothetical protein